MKMGTYANRCCDQEDGAQNCGGQNYSVQSIKCVKLNLSRDHYSVGLAKQGLNRMLKCVRLT